MFKIPRQIRFATNSFNLTNTLKHRFYKRTIIFNNDSNNVSLKRHFEKEKYNKRLSPIKFVNKRITTSSHNVTASNPKRKTENIIERRKIKKFDELSFKQKVVGATKVTTYLGVIMVGVGVFVVIIYYIYTEIFGPESSTRVFGDALDKVRADIEALSKINWLTYDWTWWTWVKPKKAASFSTANGTKHRILNFIVEGPYSYGKGSIDMLKNNKNKWTTKYIVVFLPVNCGQILKMWGFGYNSMEYKQGILGKFIPAHIGDTTKDGI
nr:4764_t:CDS:2 [Entrophospora candida]